MMIKKISAIFTAVIVTSMLFFSAFTGTAADSYKNWLQSDSRWGSKTLGGSGDTMAKIGCAVTSVAIQVVHSGSMSESNFNPGTLVDYLNKSGGLGPEGDLYWGAVTGLVSSFTYEDRAYISAGTQSGIANEIAGYIKSGYYVVLSVEYDCHWVAVDYVENGVVYMMDPAQNKTNKLFDYYSTSGMLQVRLFKGKYAPGTAPSGSTEPTAPPETDYLTGHYKTTDALNLRSSYSTSSDKLLTIPSDTTVVVTRVYGNWGETEYNGKSGWICLDYTTYTESSYKYDTGTYKCNVSSGVNMRSGIGSDKSIVCVVPYNDTVTISSVTNNWGKAAYGSYTGYICMEYLTYAQTPTATEAPTSTTAATDVTTVNTTSTVTSTTSAEPTDPKLPGDLNGNGIITVSDMVALQKYLVCDKEALNDEEIDLNNADTNGDGVVDVFDVVVLRRMLLKIK